MHKLICNVMLATLVVVLASGAASAQEKQKKKGKGRQAGAFAQMMKKAEQADLTDDEMAAVKDVAAKFTPKMKDAQAEVEKLIGKEGRKTVNEARKKASAEGKKGKEMQDAIVAALGLSDEDAKAYAKATKAVQDLSGEVRAELAKTLSPEKLQKLGLRGEAGKGKGKKKKKDR